MRYFPIFLFLCLACQPKQERAAKKLPILPAVDTLVCVSNMSWTTKNEDSTIILKICEEGYFATENAQYGRIDYMPLSDDTIKSWVKRGLLPEHSGYSGRDGRRIEIGYQIYKNKETNLKSSPFAYYEIIIKTGKETKRTAGFLYQFGYKGMSKVPFGGGIYISDTTQRFGWFVVDMPYTPKPPGQVYSTRKNPFVFSSHPKAKVLCGEYTKGSATVNRTRLDMEDKTLKPRKPNFIE